MKVYHWALLVWEGEAEEVSVLAHLVAKKRLLARWRDHFFQVHGAGALPADAEVVGMAAGCSAAPPSASPDRTPNEAFAWIMQERDGLTKGEE